MVPKLIVNVAGGPWPRPDTPIYEAFPEDMPFETAFQWSSLVGQTPAIVPVKAVIQKIDETAGRFFPLGPPVDELGVEMPPKGVKLGKFHWDYEPRNGAGNRYDLFRREYNGTTCNQYLQICMAAVRHLKEDPAKNWDVSLWGMPLLPTSRGSVPSMEDLGLGGSHADYGRTINHLSPLWQTMDFCLVSFYLRDSHVRSGPMAIYNWTRESMNLMQTLYGYKCIPAIWAHYSRGSGRNGQFVDYMDLLLQLYAFQMANVERLWLWFGVTSQVEATSEARWVREVFVPAWRTVFGELSNVDPSEPANPQEEDLVGVIDQDEADAMAVPQPVASDGRSPAGEPAVMRGVPPVAFSHDGPSMVLEVVVMNNPPPVAPNPSDHYGSD